ncbi:MAG: hypothetical protein IJ815_04980 [Lachnospiraceae bacterium]|nr:hypothetical protein [Lachnospiraceae bacterium]
MSIVKQYHKDTDTTYVYESTSYWDAEKGQSRSKRKVIGKVDPVTGEIVPTGGKGRKKKNPEVQADNVQQKSLAEDIETIRRQQIEISSLKEQISALETDNRRLKAMIKKAAQMAEKLSDICTEGMTD